MQKCHILEKFRPYHDKYRKEILKKLKGKEEKIFTVEKFLSELVEESNFYLRVTPTALKSIIKDNKIKSVFEIGGGVTVGGKEVRKISVEELYHTKIEKIPIEQLPKYGYLGNKSKLIEFTLNADMTFQYGSVILTLKRENLINRTTMTIGDSINFGDYFYKMPTFVLNPKIVALKGKLIKEKNRQKGLITQRPFEDYLNYFYQLIKTKQITPKTQFKLSEFFNGSGFEFFELQYHGEIVLDKDIERIDFFYQNHEEKEKMEELLPKLEEKSVAFERIHL